MVYCVLANRVRVEAQFKQNFQGWCSYEFIEKLRVENLSVLF